MKFPKLLPSLLILLCVEVICMQLIFDPWAKEKFERICRENARLYNPLLFYIDKCLQVREVIATIGIVSAPLFFLGSKFFGQLTILGVALYALLFYGPMMLLSERFYASVVPGFLVCLASACSIFKLLQ